MKIVELFQVLSLNPKYRIRRHVDYLKQHMDLPDGHDKENFDRVYDNFLRTFRRMTVYQVLRNGFFVLLYISAILAIARDLAPWATTLLRPIGEVANLVGFGVLTILVVVLTKAVNAVQTDMLIEHSHLVAIAIKHNDDFIVHPEYKWGVFKEYE